MRLAAIKAISAKKSAERNGDPMFARAPVVEGRPEKRKGANEKNASLEDVVLDRCTPGDFPGMVTPMSAKAHDIVQEGRSRREESMPRLELRNCASSSGIARRR